MRRIKFAHYEVGGLTAALDLLEAAEDKIERLEAQGAALREEMAEYIAACRDRVRELQASAEHEQRFNRHDEAVEMWAKREAYEHVLLELQGVLSRAEGAARPASAPEKS